MKYGVLCYTKDAETLHCIMFVLACPYSSSFLSQDMAYGEVKKKKKFKSDLFFLSHL